MKFDATLFIYFAIIRAYVSTEKINRRRSFSTVSAFDGLSTLYLRMNIRGKSPRDEKLMDEILKYTPEFQNRILIRMLQLMLKQRVASANR